MRARAAAALSSMISRPSFLSRLALGRWERVLGVLAFKLGIEAMQIAVVAVSLPALVALSRGSASSGHCGRAVLLGLGAPAGFSRLAFVPYGPTLAGMERTRKNDPARPSNFQRIKQLITATFQGWSDDKASTWAASLSFFTMLSLGPLLFIAVTVAGLVAGTDTARDAVTEQIGQLLGPKSADTVATMMRQAHQPGRGWLGTLLGIATLIFGASGVFAALQESMDSIWHVKPDPKAGLASLLRRRFLSMSMILSVGFLLTVSLVTSSVIAALGHTLRDSLPLGSALAMGLEFAVSSALLTLFFSAMFKVLPDAKVAWRDVWIGGAVTALLFNAGKLLIGLYLGRTEVASPYGAAGSLALLLIWVYYAAQIMFLGGEFTRVFAEMFGHPLEPAKDAVAVETRTVDRPRRAASH